MKTIDKTLPDHFAGILSDMEYQILLGYVLDYFRNKDMEIIQLKDGLIKLKNTHSGSDSVGELALDNLIRNCKSSEEKSWKETITQHFDRLLSNDVLLEKVVHDFEIAKSQLTIRLYGQGIMDKEEAKKNFIWQMKIPGLYSLLALNLPTRFQTIIRADSDQWGKSDEELFEIAQKNANQQAVEIIKSPQENLEILAIFSNDFSATYVLDMEHNLPEAIGQYGSIISVPTKGTAFVYAIQEATSSIMTAFEMIARQTIELYQQDPWAISSQIYWFYEGIFYLFPRREINNQLTYDFPAQLKTMLTEGFASSKN